ncbi:phosphoribosylformylglycinamidine synthase subunit PurS [Candidatus Sumerlaeota bacterium]|nr:phosphoribosylformylglycinamidine synthase subunit PurS [Candidatus Sumerlaeota bacterium]
MIARIYTNLKRDVSDPQGLAVKNALETLSFKGINKVHVGKYFVIELDSMKKSEAEKLMKAICEKLLSNPVIEDYTFTIENGNVSKKK